MSDEFELLIHLVRANAFLYDPRHCEYKDLSRKARTWREIGATLNQTGDSVKGKWKNLRDSYNKYLRFLKGDSESGKKYQNWPWANHLEFLRDSLSPRSTSSNIDETMETQPHSEEKTSSASKMSPPPAKKIKRKDLNGDVAPVWHHVRTKKSKKNDKRKLDHIDHLFLSYANTFKTFTSRTQAIMKMEMANLFGRAELSAIDGEKSSVLSPGASTSTNVSWSQNGSRHSDVGSPRYATEEDLQPNNGHLEL